MKKHFCLLMVLLTGYLSAYAQNWNFAGFLPALSQTGRISSRFNYNFFISTTIDAFDRKINNVDFPARDFQLYIQPSIIFLYDPNLNFSFSYTYQRNFPFDDGFSNEHRFWEQVLFGHNFRVGRITHRFRFEQRFQQNRAENTYPFATRLRYQAGFSIPLQGKTLDANEFYFNGYNEFYFSLTGNKNATYSENWLYAGIGYNMAGNLGRLEIGPMWQTFVRDLQGDRRNFFLLQVSWITNFNFPRKKAV